MATSGVATDLFSGRSRFRLRIAVSQTSVNESGDASRWNWSARVENLDGSSQTWAGGSFPAQVSIAGSTVFDGSTPNGAFDFRDGAAYHTIASGALWIGHDSDGRKTFSIGGSVSNASIFGSASASGSVTADRIPQAPSKPRTPTFDSATTTSISFRITTSGIDDGGAPLSGYDFQAAYDSGFSNIARSWSAAAGSGQLQIGSPLDPGTDFWIRFRAKNSQGAGPWSDSLSASTLPSVPPGMTVTPNISGTNATVALTPPQGVSSVTFYRVERRPVGGAAVVYDTPTSPLVISPLTPGSIHEYRASAFIGDYQTPWTDWVTRAQPQPNTNPGDYFDGSSADQPDVDYRWDDVANNSTSRAVAMTPAGWRSFTDGSAVSGGDGVVIRATGGRSGAFGARVTFFTDATAAGFEAGTALELPGASEVAEGGVYWGSIYVAPSRAQRMAASIIWLDAAFSPIGSAAVGESVLVAAAADPMVRLVVQGTAPLGTVYGAVGWIDVDDGAGWSLWLGGDSVMMDDAMLSIGTLYGWFSGDTASTSAWEYSWLAAANASVSQATALDPDEVDPLADPDCPPIPSPPSPPPIDDSCIEGVGSWRRYWAIISADQVSEWLDIVPTVEISTGSLPARQVRIRVYRNPDGLSPGAFPADEWDAEQIISFIPAATTVTLDGVAQRVWAEVGGAAPIGADRLLYGTGGGPASWPLLSCGTGYLISFDVPLDAPEGNLSVDVALTTRML